MSIYYRILIANRIQPILPNAIPRAFLSIIHHLVALALICTIAFVSGCATSAVIKEAQGKINTIDKIAVLKITDAYKDADGNMVHVCMQVRDIETNSEHKMTMNIPLQDHSRWHVRHPLSDGNENIYGSQSPGPFSDTYVGFLPAAKDLTRNCQRQGYQLPVFNLGVVISPFGSEAGYPKSSFRLPNGISEAVYTINQNGFPANFGYISTNKLVSDVNSIDVQSDMLLDMHTMRNQKPYLYLLTPVTVVMDTVTVTMAVAVSALLDPRTYIGIAGMTIGSE